MKKVFYLLAVAAVLLAACGEKKPSAAQQEAASEKQQVNGIARQVLNKMLEQMQEDNESVGADDGDDEDVPPIKRRVEEEPKDIRELAQWLEVPYVEEDNVPRIGVTYKEETGFFKFRFYVTGGKNGAPFGQAEWYLRGRTKGPVRATFEPMGHSIYKMFEERNGELAGWFFVDHDGERVIVVNARYETEYTIVDEEPDVFD